MRHVTALLVTFLCSVGVAEPYRYLLLPDFIPSLAREVQPQDLQYVDGDVSLVKLPVSKVEHFSHLVHEKLGACGGFMDVTPRIEAGKSAEVIVWEASTRKAQPDPSFSFVVQGRADVANFVALGNKDTYWGYISELVAFGNRSATGENGTKTAEFLQSRSRELAGHMPNFKLWTVKTDHFFANKQDSVVASLEGKDPSLPAIVLGAHMDTISTWFSDDQPGADDDASGSALLLEVLRVIGAKGALFDRTIHLVWYAAEEWGLVGSQQVVAEFQKRSLNVDAVLQFDMVAYKSIKDTHDMYLLADYTNPDLTATLKTVIETYTSATVATTECGYACSDHASWHEKGFRAAAPFEASKANMNGRLHTKDDKMNVLDKEHAFRFVQTALAFVGEVADLKTNVELAAD